jgi:hypothetical protein
MKKILGLVVLFMTTLVMGYGQAISVNGGSIQGTITDQTGAVVPGANVTITGTETGSVKVLTTDSAGFYSLGPLNPGKYNVTITSPGFQKLSVATMIQTGTATSGNFKLTLGESSQTIEVNAGAIQINTEQAGVSGVITTAQLDTLPVNGRNILDYAQLQPGVQLQPGGDGDGGFDPTKSGYSALSFSGTSGRTTRILLDGQDVTDETVGTTIFNISAGSIGEIQVNRATADPSTDITSTGSVLMSTRSGTNSFHGQLFYDFQDQRVGAATFEGVGSPFQRNQFGGSIGGPIIKDKLFFFANSERLKQDQSAGLNLPSIFSGIQSEFPNVSSPVKDTYSAGRLDYNGPWGSHMFARVNYEANFFDTGSQYSTYANRDNAPGIAAGIDLAHGRFTNSFRGSYEKFHNMIVDTTLGNTSVYNPIQGLGLFYDAAPFTSGPNPNAPQQTFQTDKQLRYDGSWTKGAHNLRYGASLNRILGGGVAAFFGYGPQVTLDPGTVLANCGGVAGADPCPTDPVNGYAPYAVQISNNQGYASENAGFGLPGGFQEDWRTGFYIVDAWKIRPTFTLTFGARYDRDTGRTNSDLAPIPCSAIVTDNFTTAPPCTGSSQLMDQWGPGLGNRVSQPNKNIAPQLGFTYNPAAAPKTVLRGGIGLYFESNVFNNTQFDRSARLATGEFASYPIICQSGTFSYPIAGKGNVTQTSTGVPISTLCGESVGQAAPAILQLQADARAGGATAIANTGFVGYGLSIQNGAAAYAPKYQSPYSININFGIQQELAPGVVLSADYVHIATLRIQQTIDANHVGDSRYLNTAAAQAAIAATASQFNCAGGSNSAAINCAIAAGATISDFASNGLDSGVAVNGGAPNSIAGSTTAAAFDGVNPAVGVGIFSFPMGKSAYDGLQMNLREQKAHPFRGVAQTNLEVSYAYSRMISTTAYNNIGTSDPFFSPPSYNNRNPTELMGYGGLDRTHIFSIGGAIQPKYGPRIGIIAHIDSAVPTNLTLDQQGSAPGEIFRSDVDGDGQIGDLVPGTEPGAYMRKVKPGSLNNLISAYNATHAGTLTPAGQALVAAGLFTPDQLVSAGAVEPTLAPGPARAYANPMLKTFDANFSYPIRWSKLPEGVSLEPSVSIYNVFNFANYNALTVGGGGGGTVLTPDDLASSGGGGNVNGPSDFAAYNAQRVSRRTGTFDQGAPRATEFQLKLNF